MNRNTWGKIKHGRNFYINSYRIGLTTLIISLVLSCIFGVSLFYIYIMEPERDFYATSGVTPPIKLQPLLTPNYSSKALLPPDQPVENENKLIPQ